MDTTRRQFLTALGTAGAAAGAALGGPAGAEAAAVPDPKTAGGTEVTTVCPFCGVGCGRVVSVKGGRVLSIEGDRQHPINQGTLCSKGAAATQVTNNPLRLKTPLYRAPGSDRWEEKSWDWMLPRIAEPVKATPSAPCRGRDDIPDARDASPPRRSCARHVGSAMSTALRDHQKILGSGRTWTACRFRNPSVEEAFCSLSGQK